MVRLLTPVRIQGTFGKALNFDGVDDYVDCGNDESLNPTEEITLCAWVLLREKKTQGIIGKDGYWHLECYGDSAKFAFEGYFGDKWRLLLSDYHPELNEWYFVCSVFRANYAGLYVNGEEVKSDDWGEGIGTLASRKVYVGKTTWAYFAGDGKKFNGTIDEVRIYNRALTQEEIIQLYGGGHIWKGLVLWLKFNEGSGTTAYDSSGYGNHGTINGATWTDRGAMILRSPVR